MDQTYEKIKDEPTTNYSTILIVSSFFRKPLKANPRALIT